MRIPHIQDMRTYGYPFIPKTAEWSAIFKSAFSMLLRSSYASHLSLKIRLIVWRTRGNVCTHDQLSFFSQCWRKNREYRHQKTSSRLIWCTFVSVLISAVSLQRRFGVSIKKHLVCFADDITDVELLAHWGRIPRFT
jgi:hypothetical protein